MLSESGDIRKGRVMLGLLRTCVLLQNLSVEKPDTRLSTIVNSTSATRRCNDRPKRRTVTVVMLGSKNFLFGRTLGSAPHYIPRQHVLVPTLTKHPSCEVNLGKLEIFSVFEG